MKILQGLRSDDPVKNGKYVGSANYEASMDDAESWDKSAHTHGLFYNFKITDEQDTALIDLNKTNDIWLDIEKIGALEGLEVFANSEALSTIIDITKVPDWLDYVILEPRPVVEEEEV